MAHRVHFKEIRKVFALFNRYKVRDINPDQQESAPTGTVEQAKETEAESATNNSKESGAE